MIQDLETTIEKLGQGEKSPDVFIPRVYDTVVKYASEVARDLKQTEWRSQFQGGLHAGYVLCLMGETEKGVEFLDKSLQIHQTNMGQYDESRSSLLQFVVDTMEEFGIDQSIVSQYRTMLTEAQDKETDKPEDLRRKIVHIEADMECAVGDLDASYSHGRREQGLLYQKLGEHESAIEHFERSMQEDRRDWRSETSIKNKLSIVDSYLAMEDHASAVESFMGLMKQLVPNELKPGDEIPDLFTGNFSQFYPYFERLGIIDSMESIAGYAKARLEQIEPKEHRDRREICKLSEILALYHTGRGEYQEASDIFDAGREQLEYKHHLSRRDQAEFALRAGNPDKARQLVVEDEAEKDNFGMDDGKTVELVNLYIQLGDVGTALDRLDVSCEHHKACLVSGSYGGIFDTRQTQIQILKAVIGDDYVQRTREYAHGRSDLFPDNGLKFLPANVEKTD